MTFQDAQQRLLAYVRDRIHNGEFTERGFARMLGISQPHVHNVLKGVRSLSVEFSDSILKLFHLSLEDLVSIEDLEANLKRRKVFEPIPELSFLSAPIGPRMPWPEGIDWGDRFPSPFPPAGAPYGLVMVRLVPDPQMPSTLHYDVAILDISERQRAAPSPEALYVVERKGEAVLRYVRPAARGLYLLTDTNVGSPESWEQLSIPYSELHQFLKGRVLWLGRERDRDLPIRQRGRFLYEVISS